jgi:hypothetical protein
MSAHPLKGVSSMYYKGQGPVVQKICVVLRYLLQLIPVDKTFIRN